MDFDLDRLGSSEFEHLTQSLALKVFGSGLRVFGSGPDGGREASYDNARSQDLASHISDFPGYTVIQAKFRDRPRDVGNNATWLLAAVSAELATWKRTTTRKRKPRRQPQTLLFVSNVKVSSVDGAGQDRIVAEAEKKAASDGLALKIVIWHHDYLCRLLTDSPAVRTTFAGFIMPGDVLSALHESLVLSNKQTADKLGRELRNQVARELVGERWVRLGQAGDENNERVSLGAAAIDLPADVDGEKVQAAAHVLAQGDRILRLPLMSGVVPHLLIVGGAGQGKTTLGQLICQAYRCAMLGNGEGTSAETQDLLKALAEDLSRVELRPPSNRRWPIRIDLSEFGDTLAGAESGSRSLLRYIAERVSRRATEVLTGSDMLYWLANWPWLVVLDGLDEVANPSVRENITTAVSDFLIECAAQKADVLIIVTTRPQGYSGEFGAHEYRRITLEWLSPVQAIACAELLVRQRLAGDEDLQDKVRARVKVAASEPVTSRLLRTPLQVAIISLLLEQRQRAPRDRFHLFDGYHSAIYAREERKPGWRGQLLEDHKADVLAIHEELALRLQRQAEGYGEHEASVPLSVLREVSIARLSDEGHAPAAAEDLADKLVTAATERLVLLVPVGEGNVGYEIRSLREYMAARALTNGDDHEVLQRLRVLLPSTHWRNTWLFSAGRIFVSREHLRDSLILLLREGDLVSPLTRLIKPGALLAGDLIDDDLALGSPKYRRDLVKHVAERLTSRLPESGHALAQTLRTEVTADAGMRADVDEALELALAAGGVRARTAHNVLKRWEKGTDSLAAAARQRLHVIDELALLPRESAAILELARQGASTKSPAVGSTLWHFLRRHGYSAPTALRPFLTGVVFVTFGLGDDPDHHILESRLGRLISGGTYKHLELIESNCLSPDGPLLALVDELARKDVAAALALRELIQFCLSRRPVGHFLSDGGDIPDLNLPEDHTYLLSTEGITMGSVEPA